jgi:hypothetical protein
MDSEEGISGKYRSSALKKTYAFNEKGEIILVDSYTDEHYDVSLSLQLFVGWLMSYLRSVRLFLQLFVGWLMSYLRSVRRK